MSLGKNLLEAVWGLLATHSVLSLGIAILDRLGVDLGSNWSTIVELVKSLDPVVMLSDPKVALVMLMLVSVTMSVLLRDSDSERWR